MLTGGGIFLLITLIGRAIAGKEAMGLGDVKLMGALGLYFGVFKISLISVLAFLIGAIISIIILITKKNRKDGYIPFGPFIVLASTTAIFVPTNIMFFVLMKIFTLGLF
jgi:leader peptidase (prepilin peptidase)/N-methyltransferase